jgi:hypothetical protein
MYKMKFFSYIYLVACLFNYKSIANNLRREDRFDTLQYYGGDSTSYSTDTSSDQAAYSSSYGENSPIGESSSAAEQSDDIKPIATSVIKKIVNHVVNNKLKSKPVKKTKHIKKTKPVKKAKPVKKPKPTKKAKPTNKKPHH